MTIMALVLFALACLAASGAVHRVTRGRNVDRALELLASQFSWGRMDIDEYQYRRARIARVVH